MEHAMACGREYAVKVMEEYKSTDPEVIAKAMGMKVSYPTYRKRRIRVLFSRNTGCRIPSASTWNAVKKAKKYLERPEIRDVLTDSHEYKQAFAGP